ncbi:putative Rubredoxin [Melia azedarach]|uniref:Rubredoxin n=1 Tax=Melia azedarach TaxID=155640 RepID=A0ACC1Y8X5_MELAZ|nr:putative Rubredoxin [Melia azedarach]
MASATTRPTFSFHLSQTSLLKPPKSHFPSTFVFPKKSSKSLFIPLSIDVSKEDKPPTSDQSVESNIPPPSPTSSSSYSAAEEEQESIDKRRLEEKFAVLNTGIYECRSCGYKYDEALGDPSYPIPPGFQFDKLPEDWRCPTCGAAKSFFESKSVEIAGFAQNQQFGLGGNTLTSGQKAVLIYGSLLFFFVLFLSGYFLQ